MKLFNTSLDFLKKRKLWLYLFIFLPLASMGQQKDTTFKVPPGEKHAGEVIGYYRHLPANYYTSTEKLPMIIFLHGRGESKRVKDASGATVIQDISVLLNSSMPPGILKNGTTTKLKNFVVISPQAPYQYWDPEFVRYIVDYMKATYPNADPDRVYLTGLSMGGAGCWKFAVKYAEKIAAMLPIASANGGHDIPCTKPELPIWGFWGELDTYKAERGLIKTYNDSCNRELQAKLTMIPQANHGTKLWGTIYQTLPYVLGVTPQVASGLTHDEIYDWMLNYSRTPANLAPVANAGPDKTALLPLNSVVLNGSGSDADGSITGYSWSLVSGSSATISNHEAASTTVSGLTAGTYVFRLTVTDNLNASAADDVTVTVIDPAPVYRINAGGETEPDIPFSWERDKSLAASAYLDPISSNHTTGSNFWSGVNNSDAPNNIFGNHRVDYSSGGPMLWNFPVSNGEYMVKLYFSDVAAGAPGVRVFDVSVEGSIVLDDFDIYSEFGTTGNQKNFQITVTDGIIDIDFAAITGYPRVDGIEIASAEAAGARMGTTEANESEALFINYPQPFDSETTLEFLATEEGLSTLEVVDSKGQVVASLFNGNVTSGKKYQVLFNGSNLAPGVYVAILKTPSEVRYQKIMIAR